MVIRLSENDKKKMLKQLNGFCTIQTFEEYLFKVIYGKNEDLNKYDESVRKIIESIKFKGDIMVLARGSAYMILYKLCKDNNTNMQYMSLKLQRDLVNTCYNAFITTKRHYEKN